MNGNGIGDACDHGPTLHVSCSSTDQPDFAGIQSAVAAAVESHTTIRIYGCGAPYDESVVVDREMAFTFLGVETGGRFVPVVDGGLFAFDLRSSSSDRAMQFNGLTLRGQVGIQSTVPVLLEEVSFDNISSTAVVLGPASHELRGVQMADTVATGIEMEGGTLVLSESMLNGLTGTALVVGGNATVRSSVIAGAAEAVLLVSGGTLDLASSTVIDSTFNGVNNAVGESVTISRTIFWNNGSADLVDVPCGNVSSSIVCGACAGSNGNACVDPLLGPDFRPLDGSPVLDSGLDPAAYNGVPCRDADGGPRLRDYDGDGLAEMDIGAFEMQMTDPPHSPGEVLALRWTDAATLVWDAEPSAEAYHIYQGAVSHLGYAGFGSCADGLDANRTDTELTDARLPDGGRVWFYLIAADELAAAGGEEGTLGVASCAERSNYDPCEAPPPQAGRLGEALP